MPPIEARIELMTCKIVLKWARELGIPIMIFKLTAPGQRGVPDRFFVHEGGVLFVEFKAPGKHPTKLQLHVHEQLRALGHEVQVHDNFSDAVAEIQASILAKTGAGSRY